MTKILFFDTETTGNTESDTLCQLAYKIYSEEGGANTETFDKLYKSAKKIPPEASAVHHITNKMIADKPVFKDSADYAKVKELFENPETIPVAHNALFDLMMLEKEDIKPLKFICTLRLARYLDKQEKIERYNLQYLRYLLEIEVDATAHDALGDVLVLEQLFERLKKKVIQEEGLDEAQALERMIEISSKPSIFHTFKFGKYNGKRIEDVAREDRGYLEWLLKQKLEAGTPDEDWIYTLEHFLDK